MLSLTKPSERDISRFIAEQENLEFSYTEIGFSKNGEAAPGYGSDRVIAKLGSGREVFDSAVTALKQWDEFKVGWVSVHPEQARIEVGTVVAVLAWHVFFWSLNACRIVYVIDEETQYGFAYGTLPNHAETGEERFSVTLDKQSDTVRYDIVAFSNPNHWWGWLALPIVRIVQNQFRRDSQRVLKRLLLEVAT